MSPKPVLQHDPERLTRRERGGLLAWGRPVEIALRVGRCAAVAALAVALRRVVVLPERLEQRSGEVSDASYAMSTASACPVRPLHTLVCRAGRVAPMCPDLAVTTPGSLSRRCARHPRNTPWRRIQGLGACWPRTVHRRRARHVGRDAPGRAVVRPGRASPALVRCELLRIQTPQILTRFGRSGGCRSVDGRSVRGL